MDIYRQEILDHYKNPHNFGHLTKSDAKAALFNSSCGDQITMELKIETNKLKSKIIDIRFFGEGCAISQASASFLTDKVKGMSVAEVLQLKPEKVYELLHTELTVSRIKCALLPLEAIQKAVVEWQSAHIV